ncbi:Transposase IS66 family protein [Candidatus Venteria ishoeyi]|uniref:Transposase IS66 family protein n=2 Tax=Candidatus Venteria ishoeyi TaxID=1899563 RepID=A0A1H6FCA8_9GAMM|nr:Transposase IS66 family protein [Candidatus Venteria ishoeyi]
MDAVYQAREGPPEENLEEKYQILLEDFKAECERIKGESKHKKARALAVEFLNDWEAIFMVLRHPHMPLTNNEAEHALRHWVIMRKITYGTQTEVGTRVFALLASVIDTCRKRDVSPWRYLEKVIGERRAGRSAPALPVAQVEGSEWLHLVS